VTVQRGMCACFCLGHSGIDQMAWSTWAQNFHVETRLLRPVSDFAWPGAGGGLGFMAVGVVVIVWVRL